MSANSKEADLQENYNEMRKKNDFPSLITAFLFLIKNKDPLILTQIVSFSLFLCFLLFEYFVMRR